MLKLNEHQAEGIVSKYRIMGRAIGVTANKNELAKLQAWYDVAVICENSLKLAKAIHATNPEVIVPDDLIAKLVPHL